MADRAAVAILLLAAFPAAFAGPEDAFRQGREAARDALRENPLPAGIDRSVVPGLPPFPLPLEGLADDPGRARLQGARRREECVRPGGDRTPECAGSAAFSEAEPWLERYPLTHGDAVFGGMAATEIDPGLLPAPLPGSCRTLTVEVAAAGTDEIVCVAGSGGAPAPPPQEAVAFSSPAGGAVTAAIAEGEGGVRSIDISTGGWVTGLLFGVHDLSLTVTVADPASIRTAELTRIRYNDWAMVRVNGAAVFVGPRGGDRLEIVGFEVCHAQGVCSPAWDLGSADPGWTALGIDIAPMLSPGENVIHARLVHGGAGILDLQGRIVLAGGGGGPRPEAGGVPGRPETPVCAELEGRDCFQDRLGVCLSWRADGSCASRELHYRCPRRVAEEVEVCPPTDPMFCADGSCFDKRDPPTGTDEFSRSVLMLELARQSGTYLDPESLRLFSGFPSRCRSRAFGLTDCCAADGGGGGGMSNSDIHSALVSGAVENGIRFAGSTHVYDALFLADAPDMLLDLFPGSGLSYAPGVSFYGIQVSHTAASGLVVGFDPASFAVAVALAIAQALLACEPEEQVLALRNGRGLCEATGSYCSRRTLLGCATETSSYCCYNSRLARTIAAAGRAQVGRGWGDAARPDCAGLTGEEIRRIDLSSVDLGPALADVAPADAGRLAEIFRERARAFAEDAAGGEGE